MEKKDSPKTKRVVFYLQPKDSVLAERKAKAASHKNIHRWSESVVLKELAK